MTWGTTTDKPVNFGPDEWDYVWFDEVKSPGKCKVEIDFKTDYDKRKQPGRKGSRGKDNGAHAPVVRITMSLLPDQLYVFYNEVAPIVFPHGKGAAQRIITIAHPVCNLWRQSKFVVTDLSQKAMGKGGGFSEVNITLEAWEPEPKEANPEEEPKKTEQEEPRGPLQTIDYLLQSGHGAGGTGLW